MNISSLPDGGSLSQIPLQEACTTILLIIWGALAWLRILPGLHATKRTFFLTVRRILPLAFRIPARLPTSLAAMSAMPRRHTAQVQGTITPLRDITTRAWADL